MVPSISVARPVAARRIPIGQTWLADVAVAAAVVAVSLALTHRGLGPPKGHDIDLSRTMLAFATGLPLLAWRRWPFVVFIVVGLISTGFAAGGIVTWLPAGLATALYLLASRSTGWTSVRMSVVVLAIAGYLTAGVAAAGIGSGDLIHTVVAWAAAWFAGERTRLRRAQQAELRELAVAEERTRIARDLHDSAAHALNVIAVRAGAARLRHEPERDHAALVAIEELARQTMADIDHVVGALRNPHMVEVPPGLAALDPLLAQHRASGHHIELTRTGNERQLAVPVDHGAYRILQEALTNAARYGTGSTEVRLTYEIDALSIVVANPIESGPPRAGGGHGLIGMHERALSVGGDLTADGTGIGFIVRARLPYTGRSR